MLRPTEILDALIASCAHSPVLTLGALLFVIVTAQTYRGKLINGPLEFPILGALPFLLYARNDILGAILDNCRLYKFKTWSVKWLGEPRFFMTTDPKNLEHILKTKFDNYPKGSNFASTLSDLLGSGIFTADGPHWKEQRQLFAHVFSERSFQGNIMSAFVESGVKLEAILASAAREGTTLDMFNLFNRFTLDSIGKIAFGVDIGSMGDPHHPFAAAFDEAQATVDERFFTPGWRLLTPFLPRERALKASITTMNEFCAALIKDRRACTGEELEGRTDVLSRAMCMEDPDTPGVYPYRGNDGALRDIILNFLIAGRDTTAQALSWCVLKVSSHPGVEEALVEEARRVMGGGGGTPTTPTTSPTTPTYELVEKQLRYTRATVLETLRLCPSVPKDLKVALHRDVLPDGTVVPPGCQVAYLPHAMGRSPEIWGEDAERFDPGRFVRTPNPSPWAFPVFNGAGPRACLGQRMALVEACFVVASIYGKFSLQLAPLEQGAPGGCPHQDSLTLPMKKGLHVTVALRR